MSELTYDSNDEMYFHWYLMTLKEHNFILEYELQPKPFILSEPVVSQYVKPMKRVENKTLEYTILNGHIYTPDAQIIWNPRVAKNVLYKDAYTFPFLDINPDEIKERCDTLPFIATCGVSYVEIKPAHDFQNMTRLVKLNQKWVFDKYKDFVNIITPQKLFNETFTPSRYFYTDKSPKERKINYKNIKTIDEFIREHNI
jgi:hypothetical protein